MASFIFRVNNDFMDLVSPQNGQGIENINLKGQIILLDINKIIPKSIISPIIINILDSLVCKLVSISVCID